MCPRLWWTVSLGGLGAVARIAPASGSLTPSADAGRLYQTSMYSNISRRAWGAGPVDGAVHEFGFQGMKEALHGSVYPNSCLCGSWRGAAHGPRALADSHDWHIDCHGRNDESVPGAGWRRCRASVKALSTRERSRVPPIDQPTICRGAEIHDRRQVEPALPGGEIRDVADPTLDRGRSRRTADSADSGRPAHYAARRW